MCGSVAAGQECLGEAVSQREADAGEDAGRQAAHEQAGAVLVLAQHGSVDVVDGVVRRGGRGWWRVFGAGAGR